MIKLLEKYLDDILADFGENTVCIYLKNMYFSSQDMRFGEIHLFSINFFSCRAYFCENFSFPKMFGKNISFRQIGMFGRFSLLENINFRDNEISRK
jgi:hypothetical protein